MKHDFTKLDISVIKIMITAHSANYGRVLTATEEKDCTITIHQLQMEIAVRKIKLNQLLLQ